MQVDDISEFVARTEMFKFQNKTLCVNISYVDLQPSLRRTLVHLATLLLSAQI